MKKLILSIALISGVGISAQSDLMQKAQDKTQNESKRIGNNLTNEAGDRIKNGDVVWGIRANALINTSSLGNLSDIKELKGSGFNIGVSAKFDIDNDFFINPELYYTHLGTNSIDLPILLGYDITDKFAIVAGPTFIYGFSEDSKNDGKQIANNMMATGKIDFDGVASKLNFGFQAGLQANLSNFAVSVKYEGALSSQVVNLVNLGTGQKFTEKVKTNAISLGLGYNF